MSESLWKVAFAGDGEASKEQTMDILFWLKEILGLLLGVGIGLSGLTGMYAMIGYVIASSLLAYLFVFKVMGMEDDVV